MYNKIIQTIGLILPFMHKSFLCSPTTATMLNFRMNVVSLKTIVYFELHCLCCGCEKNFNRINTGKAAGLDEISSHVL